MSDLISRTALLRIYKKWLPQLEREEDKGDRRGVETCIAVLEDAPTVDAVPVAHGEWLLRHVGAGHYWECSVCHTNPCIYVTKDTNYCPNCGADMREVPEPPKEEGGTQKG